MSLDTIMFGNQKNSVHTLLSLAAFSRALSLRPTMYTVAPLFSRAVAISRPIPWSQREIQTEYKDDKNDYVSPVTCTHQFRPQLQLQLGHLH